MSRRVIPIVKRALSGGRSTTATQSVTYMSRPGDGTHRPVTMIPGDVVDPLVTDAVEHVMEALHVPVYFEKYDVNRDMKTVPTEVMESIKKNKVCLKGGLKTPVGGGVSSLNMVLRKELDMYASLMHCFNVEGLPTVLVVCSEIIAVTFRGPSDSHLFGQALFGNGAAAVIVGSIRWSGRSGRPDSHDAIDGHLREAGLTFHLLKDVPGLISKHVEGEFEGDWGSSI